MIEVSPFQQDGEWLKGNLHTHTTRSDGEKDPDDVVQWYAGRGYDFLAITDHRLRTIVEPPNGSDLLLIPSMEIDGYDDSINGEYHLLGLGLGSIDETGRGDSLQSAIDQVKADGALAVLAHPHWHGHAPHVILSVQGLDGLEVFNATCDLLNAKGEAGHLWDAVLDASLWLRGFANDDAHWRRPDAGQAWTMVRPKERSAGAILEALAGGSFYGTQGPEILDFRVEANRAYARCSPVREIRFMSQRNFGLRVQAENGLIQEAEFPYRGREKYVRLVCVDAAGRMAWSNPIQRQ